MKLFLSVGHSGGKVGASAWGTTEFGECAKIALAVEKSLRPILGKKLIMVPTDFDIIPRCAFINAQCEPGDVAIELHMDSGTSSTSGCGIFYREDRALAGTSLLSRYRDVMDIPVRFTIPHTKSRFGRLGIVGDTKTTTFLIELGFISNKAELDLMKVKSATALTQAILDEFYPDAKQEIASWAKEAVKKAKQKEYIKNWDNPGEVMTDILWQHLFHNMGVLDEVDEEEPLTKQRVALLFDRLHLLG